MLIVSDSTPIIAFSRIGKIDILQQVAQELTVPEEVAREVSVYRKNRADVIALPSMNWIKVVRVKSEERVNLLLPALDKGEAEVVILALEEKADLVLIDELSAREIAESFGLNISGSVGILVKAKEKGLIISVKPLLDEMISKGVRYSKRFYDRLLAEIGEK